MKKKFREMQQEQMKQQEFHEQAETKKTSSEPHSEDYIDFEEIK